MTTREHHPDAVRKVDLYSALLLFVGLTAAAFAGWLIAAHGVHVAAIIPSLVAAYIGFTHLFKFEAPRDLPANPTEGTP